MSDIRCKLVKGIADPHPIAIVTLPQVPKENAVLKVHSTAERPSYFRVQAIAYETINEHTGTGDQSLKSGYLVVVQETSEASFRA